MPGQRGDLSGYRVLESVHHDATYSLVRARDERTGATVLLRTPSGGPEQIGYLEHEARLADRLGPEWALRPLRVIDTGLVLADAPGAPLDARRFPLALDRFFAIAVAAARAVGAMHAAGLVHQDLKPSSLFVDESTLAPTVRLSGFSLATPIDTAQRSTRLEGTLAYMSPEQTRRTRRRVDERSDLYSLGVVLYQMLTGALPFEGADALGWIHSHVAVTPLPPSVRNPTVPKVVSAIVIALLAKDPEDRYQTANGLARDLERAREQWRETGRIESFPLRAHDVSTRFLIPQRLYGREQEMRALDDAYARVATTAVPELLLVAGYSGIGKTALVETLFPSVLRDRGFFVSGKFDQFKREIPYFTLIQASRELLQMVLSESPERLAVFRQRIQAALGNNGGVIAEVIPQLDLVVGPQPPVTPLPPQETQNRFVRVFKDFLRVFGSPGQPLILFLDDLHWADAASLHLLQQMFLEPVIPHLLLVGAYRDNEVSAEHPLLRGVARLEELGARVRSLRLGPIPADALDRFVADTLFANVGDVGELSRLIVEKTGGNPFFAIQFMQNLHRERLVFFDASSGAWRWDLPAIRTRQFTENVVDFLVERLQESPEPLRKLLQIAAFTGSRSELPLLARLAGQDPAEIEAILWQGDREHFVTVTRDSVTFVHDRVQQAAYSLVSAAEREALHLQIGRMLLAEKPPGMLDDVIFDVANQFQQVPPAMLAIGERLEVAALCLRAGSKAKASAAFRSALPYLGHGLALLPDDRWESAYALTYELEIQRAQCEYFAGSVRQAAEHCVESIGKARSVEDKARIYATLINILTTRGEMAEAITRGVEALALLGLPIDVHPEPTVVDREIASIAENRAGRPISAMTELPRMRDPRMLLTTEILSELLTPALFFNRPLFHYCCALCLNISWQHGVAPATPWAATLFGALYLVRADVGKYREGYEFAKAADDLVEQHAFVSQKARVHLVFGDTARSFTFPLRTNAQYLQTSFDAAIEYGDLVWGAYACNHKITNMLAIGEPLDEVWEESVWRRKFVQRLGDQNIDDILLGQQSFVLSMQGKTERLGSFDREGFAEEEFEQGFARSQMFLMVCWYWILKGHALYLANRYDEAREAMRRAEPLLWTSPTDLQITEHHFYLALTRLALGEPADELLAQLSVWAESCPENFAQMRELVVAESARVAGRVLEAEEGYERAIASARASGFVHDEALAYERAALFYRERGFGHFAAAYLREARRCYATWGAWGKVHQLEQGFSELRHSAPLLERDGVEATVAVRSDQLDLMSVIKASQLISSEIVQTQLIDKLLAVVLEGAGALRGYLIVPGDSGFSVAAHAAMQGGRVRVHRDGLAAQKERLPSAIVHYVLRTREAVLIDDAAQPNRFSPAFVGRADRSVLALPIVKQERLVAVLYLENELLAGAFTSERLAFLELLAAQSAISLENARLYGALKQSEEKFHQLVRSAPVPLGLVAADGAITYVNDRFRTVFGYTEQDVPTLERWYQRAYPDESYRREVVARWTAAVQRSGLEGREVEPGEYEVTCKDGTVRFVEISGINLEDHVLATFVDLTARKQAEEEQKKLQAQFHHAQKMESVGRLAGGVAHDFNNLLTCILLDAEVCRKQLPKEHTARAFIDDITESAERSVAITRQLLAFARQQPITPRLIDLNDAVAGALKLLRRLIGEDIELTWTPTARIATVRMDPSQIDQILANLAVNARDAISGVGRITVSTAVVSLDAHDTELPPGEYVRLSFQDTGCGMDEATRERIFEPFFTTKEVGKGTGLGLATVYGIVRQNDGLVKVTSEPGQGSTFHIYLPRKQEEGSATTARSRPETRGGKETILLTEDEPATLRAMTRILEQLGYRLLVAVTPAQAVEHATLYQGHIDLLLTDVVMPGMSGPDLWRRVSALRPTMRCLFVSGHPGDAFGPRGILDENVKLLLKPLTFEDLACKVREVLDEP